MPAKPALAFLDAPSGACNHALAKAQSTAMPRPALTDAQRRATRRRIQQAAASLYAKNGFSDISARKLAKQAGISVGSLYSYFSNLTELMQSLWKEPLKRMLEELDSVLLTIDQPMDRLRAILETYAAFAIEQRATYRGAFLFVRPENQEKPVPLELENDRFFPLLRDSIALAQAQGLARDGDPNRLAQTVWAAIHGAIALPLNLDRLALDPPEVTLTPMIDAMLEWLSA